MIILQILFLVATYLFASIPWGLILGKSKGIDIRTVGSKNIGATNTGRVLGKKYAVLAYILDMFKGFIFVFLFRFQIIPSEYMILDPSIYGLVAVLGHSFSIFLRFKGGKAAATGSGAVCGFCPWLFPVIMIVFFLTTYLSKYVSLGSLVSCLTIFLISIVLWLVKIDPVFNFLPEVSYFFPITTFIIVVIIFIKHKENIKRIFNHQESKISW